MALEGRGRQRQATAHQPMAAGMCCRKSLPRTCTSASVAIVVAAPAIAAAAATGLFVLPCFLSHAYLQTCSVSLVQASHACCPSTAVGVYF